MGLARKQQVANVHFSDQNWIFLWMSKVSWSKDINLYIEGGKLNEFQLFLNKGYHTLKQIQFKKKKRFQGVKVKQSIPQVSDIPLIRWWKS